MTASQEIGANNPPPHAAHSMNIDDLFETISGTTAGGRVTTDKQEADLDALLDDIRKARKAADTQRAAEKKPHDDAGAAVQALWKPLLAKCDMATLEIRKLLTPYREAKQRAKDEAARKAREEADARQREAQEKLKQPEDLEARFEAEQQLAQAKKLTAVANKIERSATGLRTYWTHRITNRRDLLMHVMERYPEDLADMLNEFVRSKVASGTRDMPGVEITSERKAA